MGFSFDQSVSTFKQTWKKKLAERRNQIAELREEDPEFSRKMKLLKRVGVSYEFTFGESHGHTYSLLKFSIHPKHLPKLERLAAHDAGIRGWYKRWKASKTFRIYAMRNLHPNNEANRERYPDVGGSPYEGPSNWPKDT